MFVIQLKPKAPMVVIHSVLRSIQGVKVHYNVEVNTEPSIVLTVNGVEQDQVKTQEWLNNVPTMVLGLFHSTPVVEINDELIQLG